MYLPSSKATMKELLDSELWLVEKCESIGYNETCSWWDPIVFPLVTTVQILKLLVSVTKCPGLGSSEHWKVYSV